MNLTYAGATTSRIAARIASRTRVLSASENDAGIFARGTANGESSGFLSAMPCAWVTTFSRRNFGGMSSSAMPFRIWTTVWSINYGSAFRRATYSS